MLTTMDKKHSYDIKDRRQLENPVGGLEGAAAGYHGKGYDRISVPPADISRRRRLRARGGCHDQIQDAELADVCHVCWVVRFLRTISTDRHSLMIAEIVSNGMLSLPAALAVVGIVPGLILIVFLGVFALYTSLVLVDFKLRHPEVHNMGDAGMIMGGPILREILSAGTVIFAIFATGSQLLAGQIALATLSDHKLCLMLYTGIFAIPVLLLSFPRTLDQLAILSILACIGILIAGIVGMAAAGATSSPQPISAARSSDFYNAFLAITNPVFSYAGHFMCAYSPTHRRPNPSGKAACTNDIQSLFSSLRCAGPKMPKSPHGPSRCSPQPSTLSLPP